MANGKIETYEESARSIALNLNEFCNSSLPYPEMISDAARKASNEIDQLRLLLAEHELRQLINSHKEIPVGISNCIKALLFEIKLSE